MAFNDKEQAIIRAGQQAGKTGAEIKQAVLNSRLGIKPSQSVNIQSSKEKGLGQRIGETITDAGKQVNEAISGTGSFAGETPVRRGFEATAAAATAPVEAGLQLLPQKVRQAGDVVTKAAGGVISSLVDTLGSTPVFQWITAHPKAAKALEEVAGTLSAGGQIAGDILATQAVAQGAQKTVDVVKVGVQKTQQLLEQTNPALSRLVNRSSEIVKPTPSPEQAAGQVLQAKKPITQKDIQAFKNIDLEGVKTYSDFQKRVRDSIGNLSEKVDSYLAQDTTSVPLKKLVTKTTTGSGRVVERNFVETALDNLKELYAKTADDVGLADVEDILTKAQTSGLSKLEINNISRLYNSEFGSKAFSRVTGDPLTSVNAQAYENIRKGLKEVARSGMGGTEAAATDKIISSLYDVEGLVKKNVQAVQKLQQRIAERGILEKAGHLVSKYSDILTGGSIRGFVSGLLPRGAGYKTLNALDLQDRLSQNLKIIQKALESGSDDALVNAAKSLVK